MPQEELTWKFFRNGAASEKIEDASDFERIIDTWMADPASYSGVRENFLKLRYEEDPTVLIDELVNLANEVARAKLKRRTFPPDKNGPGASGNGDPVRNSRTPFSGNSSSSPAPVP
jgi:processive 1,2-diacylglycerol beta-glucosyltransferase